MHLFMSRIYVFKSPMYMFVPQMQTLLQARRSQHIFT